MRGLKRAIDEYFDECCWSDESGQGGEGKGSAGKKALRPPTLSGLALKLGFNSMEEFLRYKGSEKENEYLEKAKLRIENFNEEKLFDKDYVRSAIFNLSNKEEKAEEKETEDFKIPAELISAGFIDLYRDFREGGHKEYVLKGGRGSAKSSFAALVIIERMLQRKEEHCLAMRQIGVTMKDSIFAKLKWAIEILGVKNQFEFRQSPPEIIRISTGQKIYFKGADDPGKLKSIAPSFGYIGVLWLEELDQFRSEKAVRNLEQSVLRGGDGVVIKSFNPPKSKNNWVNKMCEIPKEGRLIHHSDYLSVPKKWLGQRFIDEAGYLKEINPAAYEHEYLGKCNGSGGLVFENVKIREISPEEIQAMGRTYNGIDWGWFPDPFRFCRCGYIASERRLYIFDEINANKLSNEKICERLKEKGIGYSDRITADSGGEGPKSIDDLKSMGFFIRGAQKGPGSVEYSIKWLCGLREIVIDNKKCPYTAREFLEYEFDKDKDGEIIGGYPDRNNHSIDAVRYAMEEVWRKRK